MKHFLLLVLAACCFSASAIADGNVRAVQKKLKKSGFYFGEVNGAASSDLSAAVTRFQIRQGLQITGKLDEQTSQALGIKYEAAVSDPAPASDTWRRLRKGDQQFLTKTNSRSAKFANATTALAPAQAGNGSVFTLSPERLRDYVGAYVLAGIDPQIGAELEFFGERVRYYDDGVLDRAKIGRDLQRYAAEWPERRFWLAGEVKVEPQPDSLLRVTFPLRYELRNGARKASGKVQKSLFLEVTGEDLQIVAVNESKAR